MLFAYCPPNFSKLSFFEEISVTLLLLAGDLNINTLRPTSDWFNHWSDFTLHKKCPNTELFLVRTFLYLDWIRRFTFEYRKIRTRSNFAFGHFSRSVNDTFSLANLVTNSTRFKLNKATPIALMLTNKPKSFYKSDSFVTSLSMEL